MAPRLERDVRLASVEVVMLSTWDERSPEQQALFNPAFSAALLCAAVRAYQAEREANVGMPVLASYLLLPIALHADSRAVLPATTITSLTHSLGLAPQLFVGLADRVACLRPYTSEGIRYAIAGGILRTAHPRRSLSVVFRRRLRRAGRPNRSPHTVRTEK